MQSDLTSPGRVKSSLIESAGMSGVVGLKIAVWHALWPIIWLSPLFVPRTDALKKSTPCTQLTSNRYCGNGKRR